MKFYSPINVPIITLEKKSYKGRNNNTFYTSILNVIRNGGTDYVFNQDQVRELISRLNPHETLSYNINDDGYIRVSLIVKE